mmetsp:Transcript_22819/g.52296  ORF Transcript_22819/g.52296 Transcript_22819/m.52296 type:complete len:182 (-) Transcript_22819:123-668(-)|eukprot:CAMPEP_0113309332 /NCGR_PEP_ID=MMETSP0010_2-20120614/7422_1 /TAXON_ID=216773 ORGANISM="Corethron hystrix, Strain 308" /NCGR_SAMPLE_ID=MMETSP0010_2 /ASSEMBLY_ACC=CAM_ASM_000155 /LENGTH=181 /DNA_ID=CAMNT_0000164571 /DNA_START=639 /DNA_END=1184 /DNA_ORIENTATION=- /assembly_acc=CAM_ASM_000155
MGNAAHSHLLPSGILVGVEGEGRGSDGDGDNRSLTTADVFDMYGETDLFIVPSGRKIVSMDTVETSSFLSGNDDLKPCWSDITDGTRHAQQENMISRIMCMHPSVSNKIHEQWSVAADEHSFVQNSFDSLSTRGSTTEREFIQMPNDSKKRRPMLKTRIPLAVYGDKTIDGSGFLDSYYNK